MVECKKGLITHFIASEKAHTRWCAPEDLTTIVAILLCIESFPDFDTNPNSYDF